MPWTKPLRCRLRKNKSNSNVQNPSLDRVLFIEVEGPLFPNPDQKVVSFKCSCFSETCTQNYYLNVCMKIYELDNITL